MQSLRHLLTIVRSPKTYVLAGLVIAAAAVPALVPLFSGASPPARSTVTWIGGEACESRVIYHSPQKPGYTAWVGAWSMPDQSLMVGFTQATGPVNPAKRERAPSALKKRLGAPPAYDFWGLSLSAKYLRSADGGASWTPFRTDRFRAVYPHGYAAGPTTALRDGSLLRRVNGFDLQNDRSVPHTAYLQRLAPGAARWSAPQVLMDPRRYTYEISRLRRLRDGRLTATGQYWSTPAGSPRSRLDKARAGHLLMVSQDEGRTWRRNPVNVPRGSYVFVGEWDTAELPNGDLLAVFRSRKRGNARVQERLQGVLQKRGGRWVLTGVRDAPFPHSGHPELLTTREGMVLHVATTGIHWTGDGGGSWKALRFSGPEPTYGSPYYPHALQGRDGTISVFGHRGSDDPYGRVDQAIVMDRFRLTSTRYGNPSEPLAGGRPNARPTQAGGSEGCRAAAPGGRR